MTSSFESVGDNSVTIGCLKQLAIKALWSQCTVICYCMHAASCNIKVIESGLTGKYLKNIFYQDIGGHSLTFTLPHNDLSILETVHATNMAINLPCSQVQPFSNSSLVLATLLYIYRQRYFFCNNTN